MPDPTVYFGSVSALETSTTVAAWREMILPTQKLKDFQGNAAAPGIS